MQITHFEAGDQIDAISDAGEPFDMYEQDGIRASVFTRKNGYFVPIIESGAPGSGKLDKFLDDMRALLPDPAIPIVFVEVINRRLREHLERRGIRCIDGSDPSIEGMSVDFDAVDPHVSK